MKNLLPLDATAHYFPAVIPDPDRVFELLMEEIPWEHERLRMFGKEIVMRRMVSWHADQDLTYSYSGILKKPNPWTDALLSIREIAEEICRTRFNSCLANLYPSGMDAMGWHADNERTLGKDPLIASVSLGATRRFSFRHNATGEKVSVDLENGSLLFMGSGAQEHWKHSLPRIPRLETARINLTFRCIKV